MPAEWQDEQALILRKRPWGEKGYLVRLFTSHQGTGTFYEYRSTAGNDMAQPGDLVRTNIRTRPASTMGCAKLEIVRCYSAFCRCDYLKTLVIQIVCGLLDMILAAEGHRYAYLHQETIFFLEKLSQPDCDDWRWQLCLWQFKLLAEAGYGLDWQKCAKHGANCQKEIKFISPKTGHAVCQDAAKGWEHRLLVFPAAILCEAPGSPPIEQQQQAWEIGSHFINKHFQASDKHGIFHWYRYVARQLFI